jgi:purine-nucleoside phosphorylase
MGSWSEHEFGTATLPPRAYLFAGSSSREKIDAIVGAFDNVHFHRHDVYERYLVGGAKAEVSVMFQLYGAPIMCDLVMVLKDGNVDEAVFFGTAYGIAEDLRIGDCVLPTKVQTLDGVTNRLGAGTCTAPDAEMTAMISSVLRQKRIPYRKGKSVSVPATFWHGDESQIDSDVVALELEFAAFCHCAHIAGIKAGGIFIISDTKHQGLLDDTRPPRDPRMVEIFRAIKEHRER